MSSDERKGRRIPDRPGIDVYSHPNDGPAVPCPPGYTRERHQEICRLVRAGNNRITAANACGVSAYQLRVWIDRSEKDDPWCKGFASDLANAEAHAEIDHVTVITDAAKTDPKVAAWWLERARSANWNKSQKQAVQDFITEMMAAFERYLTPAEYGKVLSIISGSQNGGGALGGAPADPDPTT
jgi:hypothetical protein